MQTSNNGVVSALLAAATHHACVKWRISSNTVLAVIHLCALWHAAPPGKGMLPATGPLGGLLLFPVAEMCFFRCGNFFGLQSWTFSAASFFPASAGFFLASDGFFPASDGFFPLPPKCIFSAAKVLLCCCKVFFLLL